MSDFFKTAAKAMPATLRNSPVELISGFIYFMILPTPLLNGWLYEYHLFYFAISFFIVQGINSIASDKGRIFYYLSALIPIGVAVLIECTSPTYLSISQLVITLLCSILFNIAIKQASNNEEFVTNAVHTLTNIGIAIVFGFATFLAISTLLLPIHIFADLSSSGSVFTPAAEIIYLVLAPFAFLLFERMKERKTLTNTGFISTTVNYIFSPLILAYGLILYIYFVKILRDWELPEGVIAKLALILLTVGVIVQIARTILPKTSFNGIFKYFGYLAIPAIIMMLISIGERIHHLGLTGNRVYLILAIATITLWCAPMVIPKINKYKILVFATIFMFMLFTYAPFFGYSSIH